MTPPRPLVLDVGCADARTALAADVERIARLEAALPHAITHRRRGGARWMTAAAGPPTPVEPLRAWLTGEAGRPHRPPRGWRPPPRLPRWLPQPATLPDGAALIVPALAAWTRPLVTLLDSRPDIRAIALLDWPLGLDWPEYTPADVVEALPGCLAALARHAACVVVPDDATARRLASMLGAARIRVEPRPSALAGAQPPPFDPALGAARYVIACGPIEARSNALLLLQIWRDAIAAGDPMPRLVLSGERGAQIEDIRPMLDWNETLRSHVAEAPGLAPSALRTLLAHAQALLVPDFAGIDEALLRDARACGVPIVTAAGEPGDTIVDPIDGRGWRAAVRAASRPPRCTTGVSLPDWPTYAARIAAHAQGT